MVVPEKRAVPARPSCAGGAFEDVDAALTWHPAPFNGVRSTNNLAVLEYYYRFKGVAAHASNAAHLGRSALDAVELMNDGVNFLREHMPQDCRVHYAITDAGGRAAMSFRRKQRYSILYVRPKCRRPWHWPNVSIRSRAERR